MDASAGFTTKNDAETGSLRGCPDCGGLFFTFVRTPAGRLCLMCARAAGYGAA